MKVAPWPHDHAQSESELRTLDAAEGMIPYRLNARFLLSLRGLDKKPIQATEEDRNEYESRLFILGSMDQENLAANEGQSTGGQGIQKAIQTDFKSCNPRLTSLRC